LDTLFGSLAVEIEAFAVCEIAEGVVLVFPPADAIEVHHILEGSLRLTVGDGEIVQAKSGAMVIVPPGHRQQLAVATAADSQRSSEGRLTVRDGMVIVDATDGHRPALRIACGTILPDDNRSYGLLDGLARPLAEDLGNVAVVAAAFDTMLKEAAAPTDGSMALTSALMKACLVVHLRRHLQSSARDDRLPPLLGDKRLGRAIAAVLAGPASLHSVESMAREAGMSRSAFAREFKGKLRVTPMGFVARIRLEQAKRLLASTGFSVGVIAHTVGFRSRSHFSRLFRAHFGIDPSTFRQQDDR
jgi:AraC family transcriptional activator of mtrCDE